MRQGKYLNVILTVNAVLVAGVLWTQLAGKPVLEATASAQGAGSPGIPNAAEQRQKMIEALRELQASVDGMKKTLESGKIKVEVTNLKDIKVEASGK